MFDSSSLLVAGTALLTFAGPIDAADLFVSSFANNGVLEDDGATGAFVDAFVSAGSGGLDGPTFLTFACPPSPPGCSEDLDGSGAIDFGDILAILAAWGNNGGPEDLDGSGSVDFGDILRVLGAWGPCPATAYTIDGMNIDLTPFDDGYDGTLDSMAIVTLDVTDNVTIADIDVVVDIAHTWAGDLVIKLVSPQGTVIDLVSRPGLAEPADDGTDCCGLDGDLLFGRVYEFDDDASMSSEAMAAEGDGTIASFSLFSSGFANEMALSTLNGASSVGIWTLFVGDSAAQDNGTLDGFTLEIRGSP